MFLCWSLSTDSIVMQTKLQPFFTEKNNFAMLIWLAISCSTENTSSLWLRCKPPLFMLWFSITCSLTPVSIHLKLSLALMKTDSTANHQHSVSQWISYLSRNMWTWWGWAFPGLLVFFIHNFPGGGGEIYFICGLSLWTYSWDWPQGKLW